MSVMGNCSVRTSNLRLLGKLVADWGHPLSGVGRFGDESADSDNKVFNKLLVLGLGNQ
jgi:hypothetical protein